jgi:hypothetical protein
LYVNGAMYIDSATPYSLVVKWPTTFKSDVYALTPAATSNGLMVATKEYVDKSISCMFLVYMQEDNTIWSNWSFSFFSNTMKIYLKQWREKNLFKECMSNL